MKIDSPIGQGAVAMGFDSLRRQFLEETGKGRKVLVYMSWDGERLQSDLVIMDEKVNAKKWVASRINKINSNKIS